MKSWWFEISGGRWGYIDARNLDEARRFVLEEYGESPRRIRRK